MVGTKRIWVFLVMCCLAGTAERARAAGPYTLTCDAARSGTFTIALTGYTFKVSGDAAEGPTGMKTGVHPTSFELQVRFAPGSNYQSMLATMQTGELMRSCRLMDGEGGGMATMPKGAFNPRIPNASAGGAFTWTFTNAAVTSVTAIGGTLPSGAMEEQIQATLSAEKYVFSM